MDIGNRIKELRVKNNMTQEKLAASLNVTAQAVSKWETGVSCPDLYLILPLAKIFHVSADELLGFNDYEQDKRYAELMQEHDQVYKTFDYEKAVAVCETAIREYPGDMQFLYNLAWATANRSYNYEDNEKYIAEQEKAIKLFDAVIKNCGDELLRAKAIAGIVRYLGHRSRKDEAKKYAEMLPEESIPKRDSVWAFCLEGEELIKFKQGKIDSCFRSLLNALHFMLIDRNQSKELIENLIKLMIPDGNYVGYHDWLFITNQSRIDFELKKENADYELVLEILAEMRTHAQIHDEIAYTNPGIYKYTAPVFDHLEEDTRRWYGSEGGTLSEDFRAYLGNKKFDVIRDREAFKNLL